MKIQLIKPWKHILKTFPVGARLEVTLDLGQTLINSGVAVPDENPHIVQAAILAKQKVWRDELTDKGLTEWEAEKVAGKFQSPAAILIQDTLPFTKRLNEKLGKIRW